MKSTVTRSSSKSADKTPSRHPEPFFFGKLNYTLLLLGLLLIFIGFILMIGGRSDSPDYFNYEMFNFRRLTLSPILLLTGYLLGIVAIMVKGKSSGENQ